MATTIKELQRKINEKNLQIKNLRENVKMLTAKHAANQQNLTKLSSDFEKFKKENFDEIGKDIIAVYLKYITEQHGTEQFDDETGESIGKMFAFTFQEQNDHVFNIMPVQDDEGRLSLVCSVTYPIEEGENQNED